MPLVRILGQEHAAQMALAWLRTGRLPHAILCSGPPGTGKRELALELAKAVLCTAPGEDNCGECTHCRRIAQAVHPDVHFLAPISGSKAGRDEAAMRAEMRQAVAETLGGACIAPDSGANISRDHVRLLQREMSYSPSDGKWRIAVIFAAEFMHPAGANALLKTLEEPPERAVFILVSAFPERLPATIRSRCQRLLLRRLGAQDVRSHLTASALSPAQIELGVKMGGGNLHLARAAATGRLDTIRDRAEQFLFAAMRQEDATYWSVCSEFSGRDNRVQLEQFLEICSMYLRDVFLRLAGGDRQVSLVDRQDAVGELLSELSPLQVEAAAQELDRAAGHLVRHMQPNLVLSGLWRSLHLPVDRLMLGPGTKITVRESTAPVGASRGKWDE